MTDNTMIYVDKKDRNLFKIVSAMRGQSMKETFRDLGLDEMKRLNQKNAI